MAKLMKEADVAAYFGVTKSTIARWRCDMIGPDYIKVNGNVRYREEDLEKWVNGNAVRH